MEGQATKYAPDKGMSAQPNGLLYVSYDGMLEPLGQSHVLAYLEKLAPDRCVHLISFEKEEQLDRGLAAAVLHARLVAVARDRANLPSEVRKRTDIAFHKSQNAAVVL